MERTLKRMAVLSFPQAGRLVHRTRLAFIHLDNLLAFGKRDRDGRVDGYLTVYLPDECLIVFLRKGDAVNAASLHTNGRQVITITEALKRMRSEVERGDDLAPVELQSRTIDLKQPGTFLPSLRQERLTGVIELISDGRVSYLRFDGGRFDEGYFCDKPDDVPVATFLETQFRSNTGHPLALSAVVFPAVADLPAQAPTSLINTYRELYWRISDEVEKELPGQGRRRAQKVCTGIMGTHKALALLSAPRGVETPEAVVRPEDLSSALSDWSLQLLEGVEVMMPGTAPRILKEATKEHRYVLQSAGFYGHLPWQLAW